MGRKTNITAISGGLGVAALAMAGPAAAFLAVGVGLLIGNKQFPSGEKPWRDLDELLNEGEHGRLEFKEALCISSKNKSAYSGISKTVAAFANTEGGELLLGVSDKAAVVGIDETIKKSGGRDKFEGALRNSIRSQLDGITDEVYRLKFESHSSRTVCRIEVVESSHQVFTHSKGDFYRRDGNQTIPMSPRDCSRLEDFK